LLKRFEGMQKNNPAVRAAFARAKAAGTPDEHMTEEALAYFLEANPKANLAQRVMEMFRQFVRAIGNTLKGMDKLKFMKWANALTEQELRNMAMKALRGAPDSLQFDNAGRRSGAVMLANARAAGYEGDDFREAEEWLRAVAKGLDMSKKARMKRAVSMGYDPKTIYSTNSVDKVLSKIKPKEDVGNWGGPFDGIFLLEGDRGGARGYPYTHQFIAVPSRVARARDKDLDYDKTMAFLNKEYGYYNLDDEQMQRLYDLTAWDDDVWDGGDNVLAKFGYDDLGDASWEAQNIRGKIAKDQGYDLIAMLDEEGTSYFAPFGSKIRSVNAAFDPDFKESSDLLASKSAMKSVLANIRRGREAMTKALLDKSSVHRAMFRQGMGWVDFVWGDEGGNVTAKGKRAGAKGLAHILEARQRKDGLSNKQAQDLLFDLVDTIAKGSESNRYEQDGLIRSTINDGKHEVLLVKNSGSNSWVVTGYEVYEPDAASSARDALAATRPESTPSRNEAGAGGETIAQTGDGSSSSDIRYSKLSDSMANLAEAATGFIENRKDNPRVFNLWHRTVGSQPHKATVDEHYKAVVDKSMDYEEDAARFMNEQADEAPLWLPKLDTLGDTANELVKRRAWKRLKDAKDAKAVSNAIFDTTLNDRPMTDAELVRDGYTPMQVAMYHQFFAAVNRSMDDLAKSEMFRMGRVMKLLPASRDMGLMETAQHYASQMADAETALMDGLQGLRYINQKEAAQVMMHRSLRTPNLHSLETVWGLTGNYSTRKENIGGFGVTYLVILSGLKS